MNDQGEQRGRKAIEGFVKKIDYDVIARNPRGQDAAILAAVDVVGTNWILEMEAVFVPEGVRAGGRALVVQDGNRLSLQALPD